MIIEAVIISVNYADLLSHTLSENIQQLDDVVVVTDPKDKETQNVCRKYSVQCVQTHVFYEEGDKFNKARAINLGLSYLKKREWLLHIDADILLCRDLKKMLERAKLNPQNIYGCDRINVYGYDSYEKLKPLLGNHYNGNWFSDPGFCHQKKETEGIDMRMGARVLHEEHGWVPIGFFQLWHQSQGKKYNHKLGSAAGSDCLFPTQWPRENRILIPDIHVFHLDPETEHGIGTNWSGRKSKKFEPERCHKCHKHHHHCECHKHHHHHHHYCKKD